MLKINKTKFKCERVNFWTHLFKQNSFDHETWSTIRYNQVQHSSEIFWNIWKTGIAFHVHFNTPTCYNYLTVNYSKSPVFHCLEGCTVVIKNDKYQLLKLSRSSYIVILLKSWKDPVLFSNIQNWKYEDSKYLRNVCHKTH